MGHKFAEIAFTESVRETQEQLGSRGGYAAMDRGEDHNHVLTEREAAFIQARDSFYMASVSETGWPYVQHRGGPIGFVRILDERTLGFADFSGNRQYVTVGNVKKDDRVSLFFMDYPNRTRLKLLGRVRLVGLEERELLDRLEADDYRAAVERGFVIDIEAFDWNCPQHIVPRFTEAQLDELITPLVEENRALRAATANGAASVQTVLGDGPLELVVSGIRQLTPRVRSFELRDPDGDDLPEFEAGAHLEVPVRLANGKHEFRHYSISSSPTRRDVYEIAVLREDEGTGGSRAVHEEFSIDLRLRCKPPQSYFELHPDERPSVLFAGGIGITPIKAMAEALKARGGSFALHYAARSRSETAFRDHLLSEHEGEASLYSSADGERMDIAQILSTMPENALIYVCGPERLIDAVASRAAELGIDADRVRYERFVASVGADAKSIEVELRRSDKRITVAADQTILDAVLEAGVDAPYSCRAGNCKTCAVKVLDGTPEHRDAALSNVDREDYGLMCTCISRATTEHLVLDL